jgi:hypothetical protein
VWLPIVTRIPPLEAGDVVIANVTTLTAARDVRDRTTGRSLALRDGKARWASKGGRWLVVIPA